MAQSKSRPSRGVLNRQEGRKHFQLSKYHPSPEIAYFVEHYWIVRWDLRDQPPFEQGVLAHPSVHLVFERDNTWIWGVVKGKFTRKLEDKGQVLGIKFRPGGFYPFLQRPVASFTDDRLPFATVFDEPPAALESRLLGSNENEQIVKQAEQFLSRKLPERDPKVGQVSGIVEQIKKEASILRVDDLVSRTDLSKRSLQRHFRRYVGVSPKWVIQRYRLHEAAEKLAAGETESWAQLALGLGYYDQAHFIRDFKSIVGQTPTEYARSIKS